MVDSKNGRSIHAVGTDCLDDCTRMLQYLISYKAGHGGGYYGSGDVADVESCEKII